MSILTSNQWSLRCRISCGLEDLDVLHAKYSWIPSRDQIRPAPAVMERKKKRYLEISEHWGNAADYILSSVFLKPVVVSSSEKFEVTDRDITEYVRFVPNEFPYGCRGNHYILWLGPKIDGSIAFSEDEITGLILTSLEDILGPDDGSFDFGW